MIDLAIKRAFEKARQRGWKHIFFAFDIHDTIVKANYDKNILPTEMYEYSENVLKYISSRKDIIMIIYTCSHPEELAKYIHFFNQKEIYFQYSNENPMILTDNKGYGCYDKKMYFDILCDDKAGFDPIKEWYLLGYTIMNQLEL